MSFKVLSAVTLYVLITETRTRNGLTRKRHFRFCDISDIYNVIYRTLPCHSFYFVLVVRVRECTRVLNLGSFQGYIGISLFSLADIKLRLRNPSKLCNYVVNLFMCFSNIDLYTDLPLNMLFYNMTFSWYFNCFRFLTYDVIVLLMKFHAPIKESNT